MVPNAIVVVIRSRRTADDRIPVVGKVETPDSNLKVCQGKGIFPTTIFKIIKKLCIQYTL